MTKHLAPALPLVIIVIASLMPESRQITVTPDTVESVTAEVDALQSKLDNILYPAYYKDLQEAFGSLEHIFGGHDEFLIKDDVLKFHDIPAH